MTLLDTNVLIYASEPDSPFCYDRFRWPCLTV